MMDPSGPIAIDKAIYAGLNLEVRPIPAEFLSFIKRESRGKIPRCDNLNKSNLFYYIYDTSSLKPLSKSC